MKKGLNETVKDYHEFHPRCLEFYILGFKIRFPLFNAKQNIVRFIADSGT